MWRKGNLCALLVRPEIGAATGENSVQLPQLIKNGTAYDLMILPLGIYLKKIITLVQKCIYTPMLDTTFLQ